MSNPIALIVEDDDDLANIFAEALQAARYDTEIARTGDRAMARLKTVTPDVVVLDLHLPGVSGMEILGQIRANPRLAHARVIVASADPVMAQSLSDQADLVLIKPISFSQLRDLANRFNPQATST
jgi:DNA-binding response OmpR family regulator